MTKFLPSEKKFKRTKFLPTQFLRTIFFNNKNIMPMNWLAFFVKNIKIELFWENFNCSLEVSESLRLRSDLS